MSSLGRRAATALNLILYYAGWAACVLGAASGHWVSGTLYGLGLAAVHLGLADRRTEELRLMLLVTAIGYTVDSAQTALGLLVFSSGQPLAGLAPPWIAVLWVLFAATLRYAFRWMWGRPLLAAAFGAVGGPAAFYAGHRLGAVTFHPTPGLSLAVLAVLWAVLFPALIAVAARGGDAGSGIYRFEHEADRD